jgi:hypothetical protein
MDQIGWEDRYDLLTKKECDEDGVIGHERSKVLLLVHGDTTAARGAVQTVIDRYRKAFDQQSVLWETARVCAAV